MKRTILPGLLAGALMLAASLVFSQLLDLIFPSLPAEYQNASLFRPWSDPLMSLYFLYPFVLAMLLSWLWGKTKPIVKGEKAWPRAWNFTLAYWLIASLPGMLITYSSFPVSLPMVVSWSIGGFLQILIAGLVFARLNK